MLTGRWLKETGIKFDKITYRYGLLRIFTSVQYLKTSLLVGVLLHTTSCRGRMV